MIATQCFTSLWLIEVTSAEIFANATSEKSWAPSDGSPHFQASRATDSGAPNLHLRDGDRIGMHLRPARWWFTDDVHWPRPANPSIKIPYVSSQTLLPLRISLHINALLPRPRRCGGRQGQYRDAPAWRSARVPGS